MSEEIDRKGRNGADSISNDVVAGETQTVDIVKEETIKNEVIEEKDEEVKKEIEEVKPEKQNINITVDKKGKKSKKEKKNRNTRSTLLFLSVLLIIVVAIGLLYLKIQELKEKYAIPKEVESVFDESVERRKDPDLEYVMALNDTYRSNDLTYKRIDYINGTLKDSNNAIPYDQVYHEFSIVQISGLKDKNIENAINKTLFDVAMNVQGSIGNRAYGYENVKANFGNVLSVEVSYSVGNGPRTIIGYNFNLETGEQIQFEDLFVSSAPIASMISDAVVKSAAWTIDKDNKSMGGYYSDLKDLDFSIAEDISLKAASIYKESKGKINFTFTTSSVSIYGLAEQVIPQEENRYTRTAVIDLVEYKDYVAIYKRFATNQNLYENRIENDSKYGFVNMQAYSMSPEQNYVINTDNLYADIYLYYLKDISNDLVKSLLNNQYLNEIRNTAMQNPSNYYNFSGTVTASLFEKPDIDYFNDYSIERAYLYYNGVRYTLHLDVGYDVLKNIDKDRFIKSLIMVSDSPYASSGARSVGILKSKDEKFFNSLNCETNYIFMSHYYKEDGTLFISDTQIRGNNYVSPFPSLDEMTDFVYKHDPEYSWFFKRRGYDIKYKKDVYNDSNYYDYYTIINERLMMEYYSES